MSPLPIYPPLHPLVSPSLSLPLSRAASPLIQRNSRRLSTPLYHCFTWEETRIRGIKEGVYREIRNVLFLVHPSFPLPTTCPYTTYLPPLSSSLTEGSADIEFRVDVFDKTFFFRQSRAHRGTFCSISMSKERSIRSFDRFSALLRYEGNWFALFSTLIRVFKRNEECSISFSR